MDSVEKVLEDYFSDLKSRDYHSNLSWENCYKFFYENRNENFEQEELLNIAALQLAFYLASWGMYRGSAFIRYYDHTVFKGLIKKLLNSEDYKNLWEDCTWLNLAEANKIIIDYFQELKLNDKDKPNKPTQTLITKILMGIFGCVPAYDRYVVEALKEHKICQTYNEQSFDDIKKWWKKEKYNKPHKFLKSDIEYPPMKLADVYLWSVGKKLQEDKKK